MIGFSRSAISVLNGAEPSITETPNSDLIHMGCRPKLLAIPSLVKAAIFESFAGQNMSESEIDVTPSIKQCIQSNFGFPVDTDTEFIYAVGLKKTEKTLVTILETVKKPWVYISGPTVNPTGLLYSNKEIENILTVCVKYGPRVVIDASFSGLQFNYEG
ncbi:hypothetical protein WN944_005716 [Citrus x changshan-huyou]|uniref:Aminotransferase class I/classII large domain-containing protein n=1 Tax=Citrus x changshan-huyou TaxID=2935761 RepID=A0AAP0MHV2_9ROSI